MLKDYCPFSLCTEVVADATTIVHGEQKSLMDSYRCYNASRVSSYYQQNGHSTTTTSVTMLLINVVNFLMFCAVFIFPPCGDDERLIGYMSFEPSHEKSNICETKGAGQLRSNCEADQRLYFRIFATDISTDTLILKSKISSF